MSRRIVLTGATGLLGGALLRRLNAEGYKLHLLGRDTKRLESLMPGECTTAYFDLEAPSPPAGLQKDDVVIHCAALLGNAGVDRDTYLKANTDSVVVLAKAARDAGARLFQFFSSVSAHGPIASDEFPLREDSPFRPGSLYGESKMLAEKALAGIEGLHVQILRPPVIYGPGANSHSSASKVFRLLRGKVFMRSAGSHNHFNVIHLDNLVDASVFLMKHGMQSASQAGDSAALPPNADTWMVRDEPGPTMRQVQEWICDEYKRCPFFLHIAPPVLLAIGALGDWLRAHGMPRFPLNLETARGFASSGFYSGHERLLQAGWRPPLETEEAVRQVARWYNAQGDSRD